ncbi:HyaD/HybD family hydrogenase maturation endopeptidase [bacterium]|nr:HyaD/HybD family hydrogenase maturation endopeptidase [bacterium]
MSENNGAILGVGNILHRDDGIGVKLLKYLDAQYQFPDNVSLVDGGTVGAQLDSSIVNKDWLVILDAVDVAGNPGDVKHLTGDQFINRQGKPKMSPHQVGFLDLIQLMKLEGTEPAELNFIGVIPEHTTEGIEISPIVDQAMGSVITKLLELLKQKDIVPVKRDPPNKPDYWWM